MDRVPNSACSGDKLLDFDEALLASYPAELKAELRAEAELLAAAFAPERRRGELEGMAAALADGARDGEMDRRRARGLAAALRRLAAESET